MFIELNDARLVKIDTIIAVAFNNFPQNFKFFTTNKTYNFYPRIDPIGEHYEMVEEHLQEVQWITNELERSSGRFIRVGIYLFNKDAIEAVELEKEYINFVMKNNHEFPVVYQNDFLARKAYQEIRKIL